MGAPMPGGGETESNPSGWTVDTLATHLATRIEDLQSMLQERYETQTKAVDAAFLAQQTAMQTALTAAERAVQTALLAAEKAVIKAELSSDKRFESVNEFRAQLSDQAATFLPRNEADVRISAVGEKAEMVTKRLADLELRISSRLDLTQGQSNGMDKAWGWLLGAVGLMGSVIAIVLSTR